MVDFSQWTKCEKHGIFIDVRFNHIRHDECPFCAVSDVNNALTVENDKLITKLNQLIPTSRPKLEVINTFVGRREKQREEQESMASD